MDPDAADAYQPPANEEDATPCADFSGRAAPLVSVHQRISWPEPRGWQGPTSVPHPSRSSPWQPEGGRGSWQWGQSRGGRGNGGPVRGGPGRALSPGHEIRRWLYHSKQRGKVIDGSFLAVSYNILSSQLAADHAPELYWHVPPAVLAWENRRRAILQELRQLAPDIISLQEVDHFDEIQADLASLGYEGTFKGRTGAEMTDGCATFWKADAFSLVAVEELEFRDLNLRENVALLAVLKHQAAPDAPARLLVVANTHILFNPKRGDIKLAQLRHLLAQAHELAQQHAGAPVLVMGDFNSSPESALYQYLSTGQLDLAATDRRNMSGGMESVWHDGRPWQPYRPSTRISILPEPSQSILPVSSTEAARRGISESQNAQAVAAGSADEILEEIPVERGPEGADAPRFETPDDPAVQSGFTGLSASLGRALNNEPGLELKRGRGGQPGPTNEWPASGDSDRQRGSGMDTEEEQVPRRRRLQSEGATGGPAADSDREGSGTSSSGQAESAQNIGFRDRPPDSEEAPELAESTRAPAGAEIAGTSRQQLSGGENFPQLLVNGSLGLESTSTPAAAEPSGRAGVSSGWQSQQRNNWGRRRPPGIDYVWEEEEFLIAAGGGRDSVVRHPLDGLRSAYATVRQPRFRGEATCAREPACTTFHGKARGTVDYIWFSPGLRPIRVLDTPPMQSLQRLRGLPTERWPSDHFCIASEFAFVADSK
ncbi:CCR4-NOT transcription complex subunit 6 [Klebsormidium nitens]|uniref:CCR4-NOT transcription complex subunit 6 n=1 Tax=Klebsormidium nitens TaxID=105231 RepID=A0A1Y1IPX7_KLENI|nr:CCR4-NOT transcription complex subunit 6 [Klebsormidium nitens]|eukprot:GAQ92102.1 CCR4-NOT transcription complex subunit 6 [Klebsormidium nitens]